MNIRQAMNDVITRVINGEVVRVRLEYKEAFLDMVEQQYSQYNIVQAMEDQTYVYYKLKENKKMSKPVPGVAAYFGPEDMAAAVHDCSGNKVVTDEGVTTGYDIKCKAGIDPSSKQCYAYKTVYTDATRNMYWIALDKNGAIFDATKGSIGMNGRENYISCSEAQFETYLAVLRTGVTFELRRLKDELRTR